ncbi:MAG: hypothetical protein JXQ76_03390 [Campylobacterales bacterium]|nr:hypothetical protein [Campylobacterales bacterium]
MFNITKHSPMVIVWFYLGLMSSLFGVTSPAVEETTNMQWSIDSNTRLPLKNLSSSSVTCQMRLDGAPWEEIVVPANSLLEYDFGATSKMLRSVSIACDTPDVALYIANNSTY